MFYDIKIFKLGLQEQVIESWDEAIIKMRKYKNFMLKKLKLQMIKIDIKRLFKIEILQSILNILEKQSNIREALKISRINGTIRKIYQKQI
ncbi:unnamed protein product [Paramecium primaurelia]|uniref:Uncharacterized protein n=1 Tax=Paramecium primaurelia TaxID=5886 RepID=A0A8S1KQ94_PARPR|nr:unnamed protein product [Paramecium primaurelia]